MADAPKTESSSSWGVFEIGIVVLIVVALLSKGNISQDTNQPTTINNNSTETSQEGYFCGLQVTSPAKNAIVTNSFTLRGITEGCYWNVREGAILSYQVIDDAGVPVSALVQVTKTSDAFPYVFEEMVTLTTTPSARSGFIVLIAPNPDTNNQTVSVRIPIRFQK
jgi:hypothetical protein